MAVDIRGGTGLFDALGSLAKFTDNIRANYHAMAELRVEDVLTEAATTQQRHLAKLAGQLDELQGNVDGTLEAIYDAAVRHTIMLVDDDTKLRTPTGATLQDRLKFAIEELRDQMEANSEGLAHTTSTASDAAGSSNVGNGQLVSELTDSFAEPLHYVLGEVVRVRCTEDGQEGTTRNPGAELFTAKGEARIPRTGADWPGGSGANKAIAVAAADVDAKNKRGENLLTNSDFENFTSGLPDNWSQVTGAAQSDFDENSTAFRGSKALEFVGDSSTKVEIKQLFGDGTLGTARTLRPLSKYSLSVWVRDDGSGPAAGVLQLAIQAVGGSIISVNPNMGLTQTASLTVDLTGVGSTYAFTSVEFTTPADIPASLELAIELTTAITTGRSVFIDQPVLQRMTQIYPGGPWVAISRGATDFVIDDFFDLTVVQNNTVNELNFYCNRMLGLQELGVELPTLSAATVLDSLIT